MKKKIQLDGMSCGHCVAHVKEALETVATDELIRQAIDDAGYTVVSID